MKTIIKINAMNRLLELLKEYTSKVSSEFFDTMEIETMGKNLTLIVNNDVANDVNSFLTEISTDMFLEKESTDSTIFYIDLELFWKKI